MDVTARSTKSFTFLPVLAFLLILISFLQGCASSSTSRDMNNTIAGGDSTGNFVGGTTNTSLSESYGNSTQTTKGALIGGATGAVAGGMASGIGIVPGAAGGAIFGGAIGAFIDSKTTVEDKLINRGCKAIVLGDQILVIIPSNKLFDDSTSDFIPYAYSTMDLVVKLVNQYPNMSVKVSAFVNPDGPEDISVALTQQQANNIVRYLWRAGLNTRVVYGAGYGGAHPVVNPLGKRFNENNRVEVTLEKLPIS